MKKGERRCRPFDISLKYNLKKISIGKSYFLFFSWWLYWWSKSKYWFKKMRKLEKLFINAEITFEFRLSPPAFLRFAFFTTIFFSLSFVMKSLSLNVCIFGNRKGWDIKFASRKRWDYSCEKGEWEWIIFFPFQLQKLGRELLSLLIFFILFRTSQKSI